MATLPNVPTLLVYCLRLVVLTKGDLDNKSVDILVIEFFITTCWCSLPSLSRRFFVRQFVIRRFDVRRFVVRRFVVTKSFKFKAHGIHDGLLERQNTFLIAYVNVSNNSIEAVFWVRLSKLSSLLNASFPIGFLYNSCLARLKIRILTWKNHGLSNSFHT